MYLYNTFVAYRIIHDYVNFDESAGTEVPWGMSTGLPHNYLPHETRLVS